MTDKEKIAFSHKNPQQKTQVFIDILSQQDKNLVFIKETVDGVTAPVRIGFLEFVGTGEKMFMTVRAPIREVDEQHQFKTRPRQKDGKFLDARGKETSEENAAREYIYMTQRDDPTKQVYAQIATLNVKNTKAGTGEPTATTLIQAKFYSDADALKAERLSFKLGRLDKEAPNYEREFQALAEEIKKVRRETGEWMNFFINDGAQVLRDRGFTVRVREMSKEEGLGR